MGLNACVFASASSLCYDLLMSAGPLAANEVYFISTELSKSDLETFIVFSNSGIINGYQRETDLASSPHLQQLFSYFGIYLQDLKFSASEDAIDCKFEVGSDTFLDQTNNDPLEPHLNVRKTENGGNEKDLLQM